MMFRLKITGRLAVGDKIILLQCSVPLEDGVINWSFDEVMKK